MSIALERLCVTVSFMIPVATMLSNWIGVGPCGCPISWRVWQIGTVSRALRNPMPVSASWADDMTFGMTLLLTRMGALRGGGGSAGLIGRFGLSDR